MIMIGRGGQTFIAKREVATVCIIVVVKEITTDIDTVQDRGLTKDLETFANTMKINDQGGDHIAIELQVRFFHISTSLIPNSFCWVK